MRFLDLTSPLMRGADVVKLQRALNAWDDATDNAPKVTVDGQYGQETAHVLGVVAYRMGLGHTVAEPAIQRVIENPKLRLPLDYERAKKRREQAAKAGQGLAGVLRQAQSHLGVSESPPGSNLGKPEPEGWQANFGMRGVSWCGCFAGSMVLAAGGHVTSRVAYCPFIEADAKSAASGFDHWSTDPAQAAAGWLVLYDWTGGKSFPEHVGVVESIESSHLTAVEGNTGGSNPSNGGMVAREERPYEFVVGFARPRFA